MDSWLKKIVKEIRGEGLPPIRKKLISRDQVWAPIKECQEKERRGR